MFGGARLLARAPARIGLQHFQQRGPAGAAQLAAAPAREYGLDRAGAVRERFADLRFGQAVAVA